MGTESGVPVGGGKAVAASSLAAVIPHGCTQWCKRGAMLMFTRLCLPYQRHAWKAEMTFSLSWVVLEQVRYLRGCWGSVVQ
jgi:hypothetical protein